MVAGFGVGCGCDVCEVVEDGSFVCVRVAVWPCGGPSGWGPVVWVSGVARVRAAARFMAPGLLIIVEVAVYVGWVGARACAVVVVVGLVVIFVTGAVWLGAVPVGGVSLFGQGCGASVVWVSLAPCAFGGFCSEDPFSAGGALLVISMGALPCTFGGFRRVDPLGPNGISGG